MQIGIVGLGNFGTALAQHLAQYHGSVTAWTRDREVVEGVNAEHKNPLYLSTIALHHGIRATGEADELNLCDVLIFAVPSKFLEPVAGMFRPKESSLCVSAIKGIDQSTGTTPIDCLKKCYGDSVRLGVVSGPGFARDIVAGLPAAFVAASASEADAKEIATLFSHGHIRAYVSNDTIGVELGGIVKNVIAIASGIIDGLALGDSARAGIITRGLAEMMRLTDALGARRETLCGLSGLGDLVLTATCDASRNRTVGLRLGKGEALDDIVESLGSVAEGVTSTGLVMELARKHGVEMPITEQVNEVLNGARTPEEMVVSLIRRPLKKEF